MPAVHAFVRIVWPALTRACLATVAGSVALSMATPLWVPTATAANSYDGTYRGEVTRTRGDDTICGRSGYQTAYTVVNDQFSVVYDTVHHIGVNVVAADDGLFHGSQTHMPVGGHTTTQLHVTGRIAGTVLDGQIDGMACARHFHLTRS